MIISVVIIIISFFLEGFMSNIFCYNFDNLSIFLTSYTIISMTLLYPYFENRKKFFVILLILGILFDIIYTGTLFINIIVFFMVFIINDYFDYNLPNNYLNTNIKSLINVILYNVITFIILVVIGYDKYSILILVKVLYSNIIATFIYTSILYLILNKIELKPIR